VKAICSWGNWAWNTCDPIAGRTVSCSISSAAKRSLKSSSSGVAQGRKPFKTATAGLFGVGLRPVRQVLVNGLFAQQGRSEFARFGQGLPAVAGRFQSPR